MRRKLCFGLLLVCSIIVGSLLSACLDVSAANITQSTPVNISSITFRDPIQNDNPVFTLIGSSTTGGVMYTIPSTRSYTNFTRLTLNFESDMQFKKGSRFKFDVLIKAYGGTQTSAIYNGLCFEGTGDFLIDSCSVEQLDLEYTPSQIRYQIGSGNPGNYFVQASTSYVSVIHLDGHYKGENDTTLSTLNFQGRFFFANFDTNGVTFIYELAFPVFTRYYTEESADEQMNDKDDEDRDNLNSQSSQTDSDAADSASDAESQGTTLLGAFSAFVTALTSASPSNCVIDMDLGNLDMGNVDFCTLSPPQPIPTIASIFLILFCVPLSIATAKKVINLFRSFQ